MPTLHQKHAASARWVALTDTGKRLTNCRLTTTPSWNCDMLFQSQCALQCEREAVCSGRHTWSAVRLVRLDGYGQDRLARLRSWLAKHTCSRSLRMKTVHPEEVRRRDREFPHPAEPGFAAKRLPSGSRLGKI